MIPDEQAMAARMLLRQIEAIGLDLDTLQAVAGGAGAAGAATVAAFAAERLEPAFTKGQRTAWAPYLELITNGYPGLCACFCDRCLDAFRGDSKWRSCACVGRGSCDCRSATSPPARWRRRRASSTAPAWATWPSGRCACRTGRSWPAGPSSGPKSAWLCATAAAATRVAPPSPTTAAQPSSTSATSPPPSTSWPSATTSPACDAISPPSSP